MALTERLALLVSLDAGGAIKGLETIGKSADRNLGRAESKLDKMGQRFQKAGAGMLAGAGLAAAGLYQAGKSAADLEQAVGGTEAVFKDVSGVIDKFAKTSAKNMGLSERAFREATTSIGGQLKGLGFSVEDAADQAIDLTGVAADLAATYGGTTAEAVSALGAAFRGEADPAERFNLFLNQNRVNAEAVALGLAETTSSVDANAKAQATLSLITKQSSDALGQFGREAGSASGQMQIASAEFENAKAALGESVAPVMAEVAGRLADLAGGFSAANEASGGFLSKMATFGTIALGAAGGLSFTVGKLISMRENLAPLVGKLKSTEGGLTKLGKAGVIAGSVFAVYQIKQFGDRMSEATVEVDKLAAALARTDKATQRELEGLVTAARAFGQLDDVVEQTADTNIVAAQRLLEVAEAAGVTGDELKALRRIVDEKRAADVQASVDAEANADATQAGADAAKDATGANKGLTGALQEQEEAYGDLLDAVLAQFDSDIGYRKSLDDTEDAVTDVTEALKEHGRNSEAYKRAILDAEAVMISQAEAAVRLATDTATANGVTLSAADKQAIYRTELGKVRDSLAPGSPLRAALDGYITKLDTVPATVDTQIKAKVDDAALDRLIEKLGIVRGSAVARSPHAILYGVRPAGERAHGGSVSAGSPYLVGERGPELFMPGRSGTIIPNNRMGGGGGMNITIVMPPGSDGRDVVEKIRQYERSNGTSWRD